MSWTAYRVILRLLTPMHIGAAKLGNLQTTRPYIPGKALWGGLTARITRDNPHLGGDYRAIGERVNQELAFSYFYPTTGEEVELWPWDDPDQFAWRFLGSYASTALNYSQFSAAEGSLHETEFIAPTTREGQPVNLHGYVCEREGSALPWRQALERLHLGGERTYGWGRLALKTEPTAATALFGRHAVELRGERPEIVLETGSSLLAHTQANGDGAILASGRVTPLVGRETPAASEHGRRLSSAVICWEPGSKTVADALIAIGSFGIWQRLR
ncbi:MAG: hypothetical protein K1X65_22870 [Caldilineales bacterium]|nr:hypothetical protein [Caldilineales bacterium]MCW5858976.1 hypothetical protein [Caldilineales bacterium]